MKMDRFMDKDETDFIQPTQPNWQSTAPKMLDVTGPSPVVGRAYCSGGDDYIGEMVDANLR